MSLKILRDKIFELRLKIFAYIRKYIREFNDI